MDQRQQQQRNCRAAAREREVLCIEFFIVLSFTLQTASSRISVPQKHKSRVSKMLMRGRLGFDSSVVRYPSSRHRAQQHTQRAAVMGFERMVLLYRDLVCTSIAARRSR